MLPENTTPHPGLDLSVCICTFRRPELLTKLLHLVLQQQSDGFTFEVVVVDNDPNASANEVLSKFTQSYPDNIKSIWLSQANISLARNAAIAASTGQWIVFIDDDEVPEPDWLSKLFASQKKFSADVVFAPVLAEYSDGVAPWLKEGGYFNRPRLPSGTIIGETDARSGNVLIRRSALTELCLGSEAGPFDADFGKTGGEDSILFRQLEQRGAKMIWCDEAPVYEWIPAERARASWLLQRSYRIGQLFIRAEIHSLNGAQKIRRLVWLECRALVQGVVALGLTLLCFPVARLKAFSWLRIAVAQLGKLSYLFTKTGQAYG